jgi:acyl-CoA thioester hydrolase
MGHGFAVRVYYEDTDLAGIVYYANYLKFIERARTEWVRGLGIDQRALKAAGLVFAVRRIEADYLRPARFDDELLVRTVVQSLTGVRIGMQQDVWRGEERLFAAQVVLVCLTDGGQPARLPAALRQALTVGLGETDAAD